MLGASHLAAEEEGGMLGADGGDPLERLFAKTFEAARVGARFPDAATQQGDATVGGDGIGDLLKLDRVFGAARTGDDCRLVADRENFRHDGKDSLILQKYSFCIKKMAEGNNLYFFALKETKTKNCLPMKIRYLKLKNWLIVTMMGLLGLSACRHSKDLANDGGKDKDSKDRDREVHVLMYGAPERIMNDSVVNVLRRDDSVVVIPSKNNQNEPREPQVTVYGVPTVDFCVKGRVTDASGKPIKGLQVMLIDSRIDTDNLPDNAYWRGELARMSDTTDATGGFEVNGSDRPWEKIRVMVRDIDGAKNGTFERQLVDVEFGEPEGGTSKWKLGTRTAEIVVKMKRKKK